MAFKPPRHDQWSKERRVRVTIVCGPPGAGKSTYVREHMKPGDLVVDVDELYRAMTLSNERFHPRAIKPFVLGARDAIIGLLAQGSLDLSRAWLITTGDNNASRSSLARRLRADVVVIEATPDECEQRMRSQGRPERHVQEMRAVAERWAREFKSEATAA